MDKAQEIYENPARNMILDLNEVSNISNTGLAAIHQIALLYSGAPQRPAHPDLTYNSNARKHIKLLNPLPEVEKNLAGAGLKLFFKVFHDLESALNSF